MNSLVDKLIWFESMEMYDEKRKLNREVGPLLFDITEVGSLSLRTDDEIRREVKDDNNTRNN